VAASDLRHTERQVFPLIFIRHHFREGGMVKSKHIIIEFNLIFRDHSATKLALILSFLIKMASHLPAPPFATTRSR